MSDKKEVRVFARDILLQFGSVLNDRSTENANRFNTSDKKQILLSWINSIIIIRGNNLNQLSDIKKGHDLIVFLETIVCIKLTTSYRQPKSFVEMANNLEIFLKFLRHLGMDTAGVNGMDIYEGKFDKIIYILVLIAKNLIEQCDNNKIIDSYYKSSKSKRSSQKFDKKMQPLELKLDQATLDNIYQLAAIHQVELEKEENLKKKEKEKKKLTAMALLSETEISKIPLTFTVHLPDGTKDVRDFDATLSLVELLEGICTAKGWLMDELEPRTMDGKEIDIDFVLGEVKDREIKFVRILATEEDKPVEQKTPKTGKRIKRMDKAKEKGLPAAALQAMAAVATGNSNGESPSPVPVRRGLTRQNSYIPIKAWNPDEDEDEIESKKRVVGRDHAIAKSQLKDIKSPLVAAMEKEHKSILNKLNLEGIKLPPIVPSRTNIKLTDIHLDSIEKDIKNLNSFENIYGGNKEFDHENYFKDLL